MPGHVAPGTMRPSGVASLLQREPCQVKEEPPMIRRRVHPSVCAAFAAIASLAVAAEPAPDFTLTDTYGQPVSLKAYRGSVLWISFGATW